MHAFTRSATLTDYWSVAHSLGLDPRQMLAEAGISEELLADPDALIGIPQVTKLLENSAQKSGQEAFGLLLAETRNLGNFGIVSLVLREEPTLRSAILAFARYMRLHNAGIELRLEECEDVALLHITMSHGRRQSIEMATGIGVRTLKLLTAGSVSPICVSFVHSRPSSLRVHQRVLGDSVEFEQEFDGIVYRRRDLDMHIPAADPQVTRQLKRWLDDRLEQLGEGFVAQVRSTIKMLLPTGQCTVKQVSDHLGMIPRTLQRRLAAEGTSPRRMIDEVRAELATAYIRNSKRKIYQVSELLGFRSQSQFSNWFKHQFGVTPKEWAAANRQDR